MRGRHVDFYNDPGRQPELLPRLWGVGRDRAVQPARRLLLAVLLPFAVVFTGIGRRQFSSVRFSSNLVTHEDHAGLFDHCQPRLGETFWIDFEDVEYLGRQALGVLINLKQTGT